MSAGGKVAIAAIAVAVLLAVAAVVTPVLLIAAAVSSSGGGSAGGYGIGLRAGTVPAAYARLVASAGRLCPSAPASIIAAQLEQESGWDPNAVSPAGAQGIAQFLPGTWPTWSAPGESPFDPAAAIPAQARYDCAIAAQIAGWQHAGQLPSAGDVTSLMLAGYNAGPYAVLGAGGIPQNGETPAYVSRITSRASHFADSTGVLAAGAVSGFAARLIGFARAEIGQPYVWAGGTYTGPSQGMCDAVLVQGGGGCGAAGFDCSGLVLFAAYQASAGKIQLPHSADAQTRTGTPVDRAGMRPGDIIGFTDPGASAAHHVGIYIGNGQMIDAPQTGSDVRVDDLGGSYYRGQQWRIVRLS